jgi:hypothetical protein
MIQGLKSALFQRLGLMNVHVHHRSSHVHQGWIHVHHPPVLHNSITFDEHGPFITGRDEQPDERGKPSGVWPKTPSCFRLFAELFPCLTGIVSTRRRTLPA